MLVLGLNPGYHDASACLVKDGEIVAFVEEERLTRAKRALGQSPVQSAKYCLAAGNVRPEDLDSIAVPWLDNVAYRRTLPGHNSKVTFDLLLNVTDKHFPPGVARMLQDLALDIPDRPPIHLVSHHLAHASSAYRPSGFDEAAVVVIDGWGDRVSTTLAVGRGRDLRPLVQFPVMHSLGAFYSAVTEYVGLAEWSEGQTMGMAAYGQALEPFGEIVLDDAGYHMSLGLKGDPWDVSVNDWQATREAWSRALEARLGPPLDGPRVGFHGGAPARAANVAAAAQATLERTVQHLARIALREAGTGHLAIAGGVGLNCSANGALHRLPEVTSLFVQPASHDAGAALGAALEVSAALGCPAAMKMEHAAWGPAYDPDTVRAALSSAGLRYREPADFVASTVDLLEAGLIVGLFQGRAEAGPRALGRRSIIARPDSTRLRDRVNAVKRRALWRPLAPSACADVGSELVQNLRTSPFMIVSDLVREEWRGKVPGVVHVDNSARPQFVERRADPLWWEMLHGFQLRTGLPCLINTSFNDETEPIVCTPGDAARTFLSIGLDALAMYPFIVERD